MNEQVMNNILHRQQCTSGAPGDPCEIGDEVVRRLVTRQQKASVVEVDLRGHAGYTSMPIDRRQLHPAGQRDSRSSVPAWRFPGRRNRGVETG